MPRTKANWPKLTLFAALLIALATALAACGSSGDNNADSDSPEYTGTPDQKITVYSGRSEELTGDLVDQYQEETGRKVDVRYGETAELASTIVEEGNNSPADLFFSQDGGALGALQKENVFVTLPDALLDQVAPEFQSKEGKWVGISGRARVVAYDTRDVKEADLPNSIIDFGDPKWKGRIGWAPTNASLQSFVTALRKIEGEDAAREWLEAIEANDPKKYDGNTEVRDAIAAGEIDVGFINHYYVALAQDEEGDDYPVDNYFLPGGDIGAMVNVAGVGVLASSNSQTAALEFTEYLLSKDGQEYFAAAEKEYPLAAGVDPDPDLVPLDSIEQPEIDLTEIDDLEGTLELMRETGAL